MRAIRQLIRRNRLKKFNALPDRDQTILKLIQSSAYLHEDEPPSYGSRIITAALTVGAFIFLLYELTKEFVNAVP